MGFDRPGLGIVAAARPGRRDFFSPRRFFVKARPGRGCTDASEQLDRAFPGRAPQGLRWWFQDLGGAHMFRSFTSTSLALAAAVLSTAMAAAPASAQQVPTGTWANESGSYIYYGAAVNDGSQYIYLVGGIQSGAGNPSGDTYRVTRRYDPANNTYTTLNDLPTQCYLNAAAFFVPSCVSYIYSFGNGYSGLGQIFRFDIAANSWTQVGNLPQNRYGAACAVIGSMIYVAGGYSNGYTNICDEFNPANNTTTTRASMTTGVYMPGMAYVPGVDKAYVMGGYSNAGYSAANQEFTPPTAGTPNGSWVARADITDQNGSAAQRAYLPAVFSIANRVYVCGGYSNAGVTTTTLEYLPTTNTWAQRANMAYQRYYCCGTDLNGKGYVFGGASYPTTAEEFTPPAFGSAPNIPTAVTQTGATPDSSLQSQADPSIPDGWTNNLISISANVTDPDAGQQVRLRVQIKPSPAAWTQANQVTTLNTPFGAQGVHTVNFTAPANGGFDWRWRVEDVFSNSYPATANTWVDAFDNASSPDFRSDQEPPSDPVAVTPSNVDIQVTSPSAGPVVLNWIEATDNGPVSGISYELQVATDGGFLGIEAQLFSTAGTSSYPVTLSVSRYDKFWRIRARDVGGNFSGWSQPLHFRVTYNDGQNHGAGDSAKNCGFTAAAAPALSAALLGAVLLGFAFRRRSAK